MSEVFNIVVVGQAGRLEYEACLFAASLRAKSPNFQGKLFVAEPQPNGRWPQDPRIQNPACKALLQDLGADIVPFENQEFGAYYPYGNKIECLSSIPNDVPFLFFDTDTLILDELMDVPFDFDRPSASNKVEGTWPEIELYGPGYTQIWKSLYDRFDLEFESSMDVTQPDEYWRRYLYFNAGFFYHRDAHEFGNRFLRYACDVRDNPSVETECQELNPWLDQVVLPLVIHGLGGGRDTLTPGFLDGTHSCHYRLMPLLFARESDHVIDTLREVTAPNKIKKVLKEYTPFKRMIYQNRGQRVRDMFDQSNLPRKERQIRNRIKSTGLWER